MWIIFPLILGVVQGLAEFLPISSSGHLALCQNFFGDGLAKYNDATAFTVLLHLGTLVAVFIVYRKDIAKMKDFQRYRTIGRVYQDPSAGTCPNLTMLENMSLADNKGKPFGLGRGVNKARENFYKEQLSILGLGLENKMNVKLGALSGGQRQAATLIMATLTPIEFLILDEHTAALDPKTADIIMELTNKVVQEKHLTAMMVTHNLRYAVEYGSRLIMMDKGHIVLDKAGEEKVNTKVDDILDIFTKISIECGN